MAILKPRNRVLIFRLTEDEYSHLQSACSTDGARSLSDFARTRLLGSLAAEPAASSVEQKLSDLQSQMRIVVERLESRNQTMTAVAAAAGAATRE